MNDGMTGQITVRPIWWVNITSVDVAFYAQCKKMNHKYLIPNMKKMIGEQ